MLIIIFSSRFFRFDSFFVVPVHVAFSVTVDFTDLTQYVSTSQINFLVLPYHLVLLEFWLLFLKRFINENPSFRFIAIVPEIYSCAGVSKFLTKYAKFKLLYSQILTEPRWLVSKHGIICSNYDFKLTYRRKAMPPQDTLRN